MNTNTSLGEKWYDDDFNRVALGLLLISALLVSSWVYANIPSESVRTGFYQIFLIFVLLCFAIEWLGENVGGDLPLSFEGWGSSSTKLLIATVAGAGIYFIATLMKVFAYNEPFQLPGLQIEQALYRNLYAPFIEEQFFAGALTPTLANYFGSKALLRNYFFAKGISILAVAVIFAGFHFAVTGGNIALIQQAFLFRLVAGVGNEIFQSTGFGLGAHIIANFVAAV